MPARCCPECFGDRGLRKSIIPSLYPEPGTCDYCGTPNTDLIEPQKLANYFELLANVYEPDPTGSPLIEWMKRDWLLFPSMGNAQAASLLDQILGESGIGCESFQPSTSFQSDGLIKWETLRDEMMHQNRWFLEVELDTDRLKELLDYLLADDLPDKWFRARLISGDTKPYPIGEMGTPPKRLVSHGRANPAGIPYLYLGSKPETAVSEIRPHTGERACVAAFTISTPLQSVDLRSPRQLVSPFLLAESSDIGQLRADIPLLERLGEELTRPVLPSGAAIDYIPSQYLCEFIKDCGHDGVVYRSSVSDGINLALFDPNKAEGGSVRLYEAERVSVKVAPV